MSGTVKIHRKCRDLLNYTIRIAFKQVVFLEKQTSRDKIDIYVIFSTPQKTQTYQNFINF